MVQIASGVRGLDEGSYRRRIYVANMQSTCEKCSPNSIVFAEASNISPLSLIYICAACTIQINQSVVEQGMDRIDSREPTYSGFVAIRGFLPFADIPCTGMAHSKPSLGTRERCRRRDISIHSLLNGLIGGVSSHCCFSLHQPLHPPTFGS